MTSPIETRARIWSRLYNGETHIDFVGRFRLWVGISVAVILVGLGALWARGLNLGIDFEGGTAWEVPAGDASVADAREALEPILDESTIQTLESEGEVRLRVESEESDTETQAEVSAALADLTGSDTDSVSVNLVGPSWGEELSEKALRALIFFLIAIGIYISFRFEWKMAVPTLVALLHDLLVTVGVYAVFGFEVTPATVIAILTILGFSIYDGIVVFDRVDENTKLVSSTGGMTYSAMVNRSLNEVLMRSLNTSVTALLPVASLLIVGSWILGAVTLQEFALALLVGIFAGAYSSIFIASPMLAVMKERERRYRDIRERIVARGGAVTKIAPDPLGTVEPRPAPRVRSDDLDDGAAEDELVATPAVELSGRVIPPRPRKKTRRKR